MAKAKAAARTPRVSVVLTSYNQVQFLRQSIESVLAQTYSDFELILWDDCSSDGSWEMIEAQTDPRIRAFRNDTNRRGIYGLNRAFSEIARGEYFAVHHSDDAWEPQKLAKQVAYLDARPLKGAVFTWVTVIDDDGAITDQEWFNQTGLTREVLLRQLFLGENHLNHPSIMFRRACYRETGPYCRALAQTGDAEMWSRLLLKFDVSVIEERLTLHRLAQTQRNTSSISSSTIIRTNNEWSVLRRNYLKVSSADFLFLVFPELAPWKSAPQHHSAFLLAMVCFTMPPHAGSQSLGVEWLYDLVLDPETAVFLETYYQFTYLDLIALTKEIDAYGFLEAEVAARTLAQYQADQARLETLVSVAAERETQILQMLSLREQELVEQTARLDALGKTVVVKNQSLADLTETLDQRQRELREFEHRLDATNRELIDRERKITQLLSDLDHNQKRNRDLENTLDMANKGILDVTIKLDDKQKLLREFESRLDHMGKTLQTREEALQQTTAILDTRQHELLDAVSRLDAAGHRILDCEHSLNELTGKHLLLDDENHRIEGELERERVQAAVLRSEIDHLTQGLVKCEQDRVNLHQRINELSREVCDREELLLHATKVRSAGKG